MPEVVTTDEFADWYGALSEEDAEAVTFSVELLQEKGVGLGHPHSSAIKGTQAGLRELRVQSQGRPLRVFYAFDPIRQAVLLIGGDKTGDGRFYEKLVPQAEKLWEQYLSEQRQGLHKRDDS